MNRNIARQLFIAAVAVTGINFLSSCESCNRKDGDTETNQTTVDGIDDTYSNDTIIDANNSGNGTGSGSSYSGSSNSSQNTGAGPSGNAGSGSTSGSGGTTSGSTGATGSTSKGNTNTYDPNNDPVENSNYYRNKKAGSVDGGGSAGNGQGTGTGTTGNNSRVSDPRDQKS